jgi:enoyl-CoA hydratase
MARLSLSKGVRCSRVVLTRDQELLSLGLKSSMKLALASSSSTTHDFNNHQTYSCYSFFTMLAARLRPCATQFGKFALPLRVQYSSAAEKTYEHIKVSTPRPGVGLGEHCRHRYVEDTTLTTPS